jgi:membrane-bound lytic murein transglycosylase D
MKLDSLCSASHQPSRRSGQCLPAPAALLALALLCLPPVLLPQPLHAADPGILQPSELEPDVRFWMRVYSEVSTNEGYIHDQRRLSVVYQTLHFAPDLPPREREAQVEAAREHYRQMLRHLASGAAPQDDDERRVQGLWADATPQQLLQSADDVRFQLGQSDRFRAGLERAGIWEEHIARSLATQGLPPEIAVLPHVESSFQPQAMSKAGAAGMWQFIRSTGRRFLRIDKAVDERLDPYRETDAAAQLLAYNYRVLGSWPLAITAYNHGAEGMRRARNQLGTDDIVKIVRNYKSPSFGFASRNYYASFLAALRLDRDPEKYFGPMKRHPPAPTQVLALPAATRVDVLQKALGVDAQELRDLNPALRPPVWNLQRPVPLGYQLRLPAEGKQWTSQLLARQLSAAPAPTAVLASAMTRPAGNAVAAVSTTVAAKPSKPALAAAVAPVATVVAAGPTPAAAPAATPSGAPVLASAPALAPESALSSTVYVVQHGDSLASIALAAGLPPEVLVNLNALRLEDRIYEGQQLVIAGLSGEALAEAMRAAELEQQEETQALAAAARAPAPVTVAEAQEQGPSLVPEESAPASADPIDYSVRASDSSLVVVADETIGHYADWLGVPTATLRALNHMRGHSTVLMGRRFKLSFAKVAREQFETRRREYHQKLQTDYFAVHRIVGAEPYVARRGDSLWSVTQRGTLPAWLLQQYNPDVDFAVLRPGTQIMLPRVDQTS